MAFCCKDENKFARKCKEIKAKKYLKCSETASTMIKWLNWFRDFTVLEMGNQKMEERERGNEREWIGFDSATLINGDIGLLEK